MHVWARTIIANNTNDQLRQVYMQEAITAAGFVLSTR